MPQQDNPQLHENFDAPHQVVDARQLATASSEGMDGGEPTALSEVLQAKEALELSPTDLAYELVLKDLEARRLKGGGDADLIAQAIAALGALHRKTGK
jgi:hypothetical protein